MTPPRVGPSIALDGKGYIFSLLGAPITRESVTGRVRTPLRPWPSASLRRLDGRVCRSGLGLVPKRKPSSIAFLGSPPARGVLVGALSVSQHSISPGGKRGSCCILHAPLPYAANRWR